MIPTPGHCWALVALLSVHVGRNLRASVINDNLLENSRSPDPVCAQYFMI